MKIVQSSKWVIVSVLAIALVLSACMRSPAAKSAGYIDTGKKLLEQHDPARAILQFKNAVQITPKNPEAHYQLALGYLATGDFNQAAAQLSRTLELDPKHAGAQLRLGQLMTYTNDPEVLKKAHQLLENVLHGSPEDAEVLHGLALTELKLGELDDAAGHLARAMRSAPQEVAYAATMAQAKIQQKDFKGAEEVLRQAREKSPKSADALVILGRFYFSQNRLAESEQQFRQALALDPNHVAGLLNLATLQSFMGRNQEAEKNLQRLSSLPDQRYKDVHATFLYQEGRRDEAIREFENLFKKAPEDRLTRTRLVAAYYGANRNADGRRILDAALKQNPKDVDALLQRGELSLAERKYNDAEADLSRAVHFRPDAAVVHYAMARLQQARGATQTQRLELTEALRLNPLLLPARLELARAWINSHNAKEALDLLDAATGQKNLISWIEERNWALLALGRQEEAQASVAQGLAAVETPTLLLQDAIVKIRAKRIAEARKSLQKALVKAPEDLRALRILVRSYVVENNVRRGVEEVRAYAAKHPRSAAIQYFLGNLLLATGDREEARKALLLAKTTSPNYQPADLSLARVDLLGANWKDARQELSTILSTQGENPLARQWLGMLEVSVGNRAAAIADFRKVVETQPNAIALNNLAFLLAENGDAGTEALKCAQKAVEMAPDNPEFKDTLGWVLYQQGLYDAAINYLEAAVSKGAGARTLYHLAMANLKAGNKERGRDLLREGLSKDANLPEAKAALQLFGAGRANPKP